MESRHEFERIESSQTTLVIVGIDGQELGLVVDGLLGEQDVVIKSMEENFRNIAGVAGASILGDGRVSLILDVSALMDMARRNKRTDAAHDAPSILAKPDGTQLAHGAGTVAENQRP